MPSVNSRELLKQYALRELGAPVIQINVDDTQLEDRIDEALTYFQEYHTDGTEKIYLSYQITSADITNKYIPVPDSIFGVSRIIPIQSGSSIKNIFDIQYQLRLNDLPNLTSTDIVYFSNSMNNLALLDHVLHGQDLIRFNRFKNRIELDVTWGLDIIEGQFIVLDTYKAMDTTTYSRVWGNPWLKKYTTALFKRQWGANAKKYSGMQLPGGIMLDGQKIYDEAIEEIKQLEEELIDQSAPLEFFTG
jgi:hypothetical protein